MYKNVDDLLNGFHNAAERSDLGDYIRCFAKNGVYIGTDSNERWSVDEFETFLTPIFSRRLGWSNKPLLNSRHYNYYPNQSNPVIVTFDELLNNYQFKSLLRGSGTAVLDTASGSWKIMQYHISFTIPNEIANSISNKVSLYEIEKESIATESNILNILGEIEVEKAILQQKVSSYKSSVRK